jgi:hypothetical protein
MYCNRPNLASLTGCEARFEHVWMSRDSHPDKVPGFVEFHPLKSPEAEDHTLYARSTCVSPRSLTLYSDNGWTGLPHGRLRWLITSAPSVWSKVLSS